MGLCLPMVTEKSVIDVNPLGLPWDGVYAV
jgi:hypothetical protein